MIEKLSSIKAGIEEEVGDDFARNKLVEMMNFLISNSELERNMMSHPKLRTYASAKSVDGMNLSDDMS